MINQIVETFEYYSSLKFILYNFRSIDKYIKNTDTHEVWSFFRSDIENLQWSKQPVKAFFLRLLGVIKIIFGLFLVSNTTAIYIIITVISAPILLLGLCIKIFFLI